MVRKSYQHIFAYPCPMHLGLEISATATPHPGGIHRYIRGLVPALTRLPGMELSLWVRLSRLQRRRYWWRPPGISVRTYQGRWWPPAPRVDLVHGLDGTLPDWPRVPKVATIHDLAVLRSADGDIAGASFRNTKRARYQDVVRRADRLIAVSECTKGDLVRLLGAKPERIAVIPLGVSPRFRPLPAEQVLPTLKRLSLEPGYLLFVGVVSQRKNTARLVRAYAASAAARQRPLVLAGRVYHRSRETLEAIHAQGLDRHVMLPGEIAEADLPALYNGASALVFPTLYEGFGLPILEAMACGVPVVCADRGGAAEVARDYAVKVDPESVDAISAGIEQALALDAATREAAREYARGYTWRACAERTAVLYRELL